MKTLKNIRDLELKEEKDEENFLRLAIKGFKSMATAFGKFDKELEGLAKDAAKQARKGYQAFQKWFQKLDAGDKLALAGELSFYTKQKDKTIEKMLKYKFEGKVNK